MGYLQAELQRLDSPGPGPGVPPGFELCGRLEWQFGFIAAAVEPFQRQRVPASAACNGCVSSIISVDLPWGFMPQDSPACASEA